jgi:hypothetical protein
MYVGTVTPDSGAMAMVCMRFTLCSLGCRHSMHAMLRLESERGTSEQWSGVGVAVPEVC